MGLLRLPLLLYPCFTGLTVLLAVTAVHNGSAVPAPLLIGPAVMIALMILLDLSSAQVLSPLERARKIFWMDFWGMCWAFVAVPLACSSSLMPSIVAIWHRHSWLGEYDVVLALCLVACKYHPLPAAVFRIRGLQRLAGSLDQTLVQKGLAVFLTGLFSEDRGIAEFAAWLVLFQLCSRLHHLYISTHQPLWIFRRYDAHRYVNGTPDHQRRVADLWIEEDVRGETNPRLNLVHSLCDEAMTAAQGHEPHPGLARALKAEKRPGQAAKSWLNAASGLLAEAKRALSDPTPAQRRALDLAEAHLIRFRLHLDFIVGRHERALKDQRKVRDLWSRHGLHNLSANNLCVELIGARAEGTKPAVPERALAELKQHLQQPGLVPYVRSSLLLLAAEYATLTAKFEEAEQMRAERYLLVIGRADFRILNREQRAAGMPRFPASQYRMTFADLEALDARTRGQGPLRDDVTRPPRIILSNLPGGRAGQQAATGMRLWLDGKPTAAADALNEAAALLQRDGFNTDAFNVLLQLAPAQRAIDPPAAYETYTRALQLQQRLRTGLVSAGLRLATGATTEHLARALTDLLLRIHPAPAPPALTAFELSELSRSRTLLDQLGTRSALPIDYPALRNLLTEATTQLDAHKVVR
ncbi:hypothetical protein ACFWIZ_05420 [Streptomyces sp. NPDC127044]